MYFKKDKEDLLKKKLPNKIKLEILDRINNYDQKSRKLIKLMIKLRKR